MSKTEQLRRVRRRTRQLREEVKRLRMENKAMRLKLSRWGRPTKEEIARRMDQAKDAMMEWFRE